MEKPGKSVLETTHPLFIKIKRELPFLSPRAADHENPWIARFQALSRKHDFTRVALIMLASLVISFFIYRQIADPFLDYRLGDTAKRHLVAQHTMEMIDEETTDAKRKSAMEAVLPVYDYDRRLSLQIRGKINRAFATLRKQHQAVVNISGRRMAPGELEKNQAFIDAKKDFSEILEIDVTDAQFEALVRLKFDTRVERIFEHFIADAYVNLIVTSRELLKADSSHGITLNRLDESADKRSEIVFQNISAIIDVEAARNEMQGKAHLFLDGARNESLNPYNERILALAKRLVVPNLTLNRQETERRRAAVTQEIKPVIVRINKGESVVRFDETINKRHLAILRQMQKDELNDNSRLQFFFTAVFLFAIIFSIVAFLQGGIPAFRITNQDFLTLCLLMVATILLVKGVQFIAAEALIEKFPQVPFDFYYYMLPLSAGPVIVRMLMGKQPALLFSVVLAIVGGILLERNFFFAAYILGSSLTAAQLAHSIKTRSVIYRAGLITGALNMVLIICIIANTRNAASLSMLWEDSGWIFWAGILSGVVMAMIAVSVVPVAELVSGRTSDLRLLELANMNHPLLRDLMVKAPGTYHHCIVIGSLVEAAAENIGANPLMARVMAYYHDVGKMERPLYFIENQGGGYNRHDALQPHMSAMVIREHVKKGQELGRKFKLPQPLIDAMSEHHGSSTIWYFYNKARSQADEPDSVLESDYKYDGQKPQSKETALVMLGDVVEAATRSVADPTPLRLSGVVKNILNKYFAEGQLSECDLTLRDLDLIAKSFLDVLLGIYHARIEYGVSSIRENAKRKPNGGTDSKNNPRPQGGPGVAAASGGTPYTRPFRVPGSGGGGPKKS
ncbi:MAG: HD family phosphohydrolase [Bdellovibrionota bacterium]